MEDRSNGRVSSSGAPTAPPGSHPGWGLRRAGTQVRHRPMGDEDPVHHHPDRDPRKPDHRLPDPVDPDAVGVTDLPGRLESLVRSTPWLLEALRAAKNQAAVHTWYGRVFGGRVAPCGLDGLFGLVCRRNPRRVTVAHYHQRLRDKRVADRWPKVEIVLEGQDAP